MAKTPTIRQARTINAIAEDSMRRGDYLAPHASHRPTSARARSFRRGQVAGARPRGGESLKTLLARLHRQGVFKK